MRSDRASPRAECRILGWWGSTSRVRRSQCSMPGAYPPGSLLGGVAQAVHRLADDPRDVHLRDTDALADLGLGEVLGEAQPQHLALALVEHAHQPLPRGGVLGHAEARVLDAQDDAGRLALLVVVPRAVQRHGAV